MPKSLLKISVWINRLQTPTSPCYPGENNILLISLIAFSCFFSGLLKKQFKSLNIVVVLLTLL